MNRAQVRSYWNLLLAAAAVALALLYWGLSLRGAAPEAGEPVFYPGLLIYNRTSAACATTLVLVAITLLGLWVPQALRRAPRMGRNGVVAALALGAALVACWSSLPAQLIQYHHIDSAALAGRVYQLGIQVRVERAVFVVSECDPPGWVCRWQPLTDVAVPELTERPVLLAEPERGMLAIRMGSETVYELRP